MHTKIKANLTLYNNIRYLTDKTDTGSQPQILKVRVITWHFYKSLKRQIQDDHFFKND